MISASLFRLSKVRPKRKLSGPIPYPGGKARVAPLIIRMLPPHDTYVETFAGGASVFFAKPLARRNVLNDLDRQMVSLYRGFSCRKLVPCILQNPPTEENKRKFVHRFQRGSTDPCDVLLARMYSFGATGHGVSTSPTKGTDLLANCPTYEAKLQRTTVENEDFRTVIRKYDSPSTAFFLDPPYPKVGDDLYRRHHGVTAGEVCGSIRRIRGKALITLPNSPEVRSACAGLSMRSYELPYSDWKGGKREATELLIANYPLR